jgi:hypothetical protein
MLARKLKRLKAEQAELQLRHRALQLRVLLLTGVPYAKSVAATADQ